MRIFLLFAWLLSLSFSAVQAQQNEIDSLMRVLKTHQKIDSTRVKIYRDISFAYYALHAPETGLKYADSALSVAQKLQDNKWLGKAYSIYALNYWDNAQYREALDKYEKAAECSKTAKDFDNLGITYHNIGLLYNTLGEYRKAIDYHEKAYDLFIDLPGKHKSLAALNSIGANYLYLSNYPKAIDYYIKVLKLAEEIDDYQMVGLSYENIGGVYKRMNDYEKASACFEKALDAFFKINDKDNAINVYNLYGTAKDQSGDHKGAIVLYEKGLKLAEETHNEKLKYDLINNSGISYLALKDHAKALNCLKQSSAYYKQIENIWKLSVAYNYYAKTLTEAPDEILKKEGVNPADKYNIAVSLLSESVKYAQEDEALNEEMSAREILSDVYAKTGDYAKALDEYKKASALKDSIVNDETNEEILKKEMQYEADKKQVIAEAEIAQQKIIRNSVIAVSVIIFLFGIVLSWFIRKRQKINEERKELLLKAKISDTELKALRAQMNPHFIFNSLNSIADYIHKNDPKSADYYLAKFAKLMRGILENSEEKEITLAEELRILELYIQLEASRLKHKFSYEIKITPDINPEIVMVPPLIIQPFVENSIWHGLSPKEGNGKLVIEITKENELLNIKVEDDGIGRRDTDADKKSYGHKLTQDRIKLHDKQSNSHSGVYLIDIENGTRIEIKLPITEKEI